MAPPLNINCDRQNMHKKIHSFRYTHLKKEERICTLTPHTGGIRGLILKTGGIPSSSGAAGPTACYQSQSFRRTGPGAASTFSSCMSRRERDIFITTEKNTSFPPGTWFCTVPEKKAVSITAATTRRYLDPLHRFRCHQHPAALWFQKTENTCIHSGTSLNTAIFSSGSLESSRNASPHYEEACIYRLHLLFILLSRLSDKKRGASLPIWRDR